MLIEVNTMIRSERMMIEQNSLKVSTQNFIRVQSWNVLSVSDRLLMAHILKKILGIYVVTAKVGIRQLCKGDSESRSLPSRTQLTSCLVSRYLLGE